MVAQFLDRNDAAQPYHAFEQAYRQRFKQSPGFAGAAGYDAALVAIDVYRARKRHESLKNIIIAKREFQGVQQVLKIDRFGDADRKTFVTLVRNGSYITVE